MSIKVIAVIAILATTSCKKKEELASQQIDAKNMVVPAGQLAIQDDSMKKKLNPDDYPVIAFDSKEIDFGTIKQGDKVEHVFKFKNTGKTDLTVIDVRPSCGCTAPEWTKTPVKNGESGEIKIVFNSAGKSGQQTKSIALVTNTMEGNEILTFKANILGGENNKQVINTENTKHNH